MSSASDSRRRAVVSPNGLEEDAVSEEEVGDNSESPYLGGISVSRFWLIYAGLLSNLVNFHAIESSTAVGLIQWVVCCMF